MMASNLSRFRNYEALPLARLEGVTAEHSLNLTLRPRIEHLLAVLSQCSVGGDMPVEGLQIEMRDFVSATRHVGAQRVFVGDRLVVDEAVGAGRADGPAHGVERAAFYPGNLCPTSAAELRMPFTTWILIGMGRAPSDRPALCRAGVGLWCDGGARRSSAARQGGDDHRRGQGMGCRHRLPQGQGPRLSPRIVDDATACPPCA